MKLSSLALGTAALIVVSLGSTAQAHFVLQAPQNWLSQDKMGVPIKLGPCGDEPGTTASPSTPTNYVTTFQMGQKVTFTIDEVVFHPGHYRVALAADHPSLPADPAVTADANSPCGSAAIQSPAVMPVLIDDALDHTTVFSSPQSFSVTLPAGYTCDKCVLQVIEFMGDHPLNNPGGCFYHHCADVRISADVVADGGSTDAGPPDAGADMGATAPLDGGSKTTKPDLGKRAPAGAAKLPGCSIGTQGGTQRASSIPVVLLLVCAALLLRRRSL